MVTAPTAPENLGLINLLYLLCLRAGRDNAISHIWHARPAAPRRWTSGIRIGVGVVMYGTLAE
eukprot:15451193-Alexandrium_andersonii.AAC.1